MGRDVADWIGLMKNLYTCFKNYIFGLTYIADAKVLKEFPRIF